MDKFKNIREVTSPLSHSNNSPFETHQSVVMQRNTFTEINPTRLDFRESNSGFNTKFSNINMSESQVVANGFKPASSAISYQQGNSNPFGYSNSTLMNYGSNNSNNTFFRNEGSYIRNSAIQSNQESNVFSNSQINSRDPMKESTMSYIRSISRNIPNISEERLRTISDNFMRLYGTDRTITQNGVKNIQK